MTHDDLVKPIVRRSKAPDRTRALSKTEVEALLTREDISIRERVLWRLLYETAARSAEVLRLDLQDLDLPNRRAKVKRKGGAVDIIVWQTGTARLLPRLLKGRTSGPLFLTDRKARVQLPPGDLDPANGKARLSYRRAAEIFEQATGGLTVGRGDVVLGLADLLSSGVICSAGWSTRAVLPVTADVQWPNVATAVTRYPPKLARLVRLLRVSGWSAPRTQV
jgi:hypothetical protein